MNYVPRFAAAVVAGFVLGDGTSVGLAADVTGLPEASAATKALLGEGLNKGLDSTLANTLQINLNAATHGGNNIVLEWNRFDVGPGKNALFSLTPDAAQHPMAVLNRVEQLGGLSRIDGRLESFLSLDPSQKFGDIYIVNPAGIVIGKDARVNVGGLFLSTLAITGEAWKSALDQGYPLWFATDAASGATVGVQFELAQPVSPAEIAVEAGAQITAVNDAVLIGQHVKNAGQISAGRYSALVAGNTVEVRQLDEGAPGGERVSVKVRGAALGGNGVENQPGGMLEGAIAELRAAGGNIYALAIKNEGRIRARNARQAAQDLAASLVARADPVPAAPNAPAEPAEYGIVANSGQIEVADAGTIRVAGSEFRGGEGGIIQGGKTVDVSIKTFGAGGDVTLGATSGRDIVLESSGAVSFAKGVVQSERNLEITAKGGDVTQSSGSSVTVGADPALQGKLIIDAPDHDVTLIGSAGREPDVSPLAIERLATGGFRLHWPITAGRLALERRSVGTEVRWEAIEVKTDGDSYVADLPGLDAGALFRVAVIEGGVNAAKVQVKAAKNFRLATGGALTLEEVKVAGDLDIAAGGAITQAEGSSVQVAGSSFFAVRDIAPRDVTLSSEQNAFAHEVSVSGAANVSLRNKANLTLGTIHTSDLLSTPELTEGDLNVTAENNLSQAPGTVLRVSGTTKLEAGGTITLANANEFLGSVEVAKGLDTTLTSAGGLKLGHFELSDLPATDTIEGNLALEVAGDLTQAPGASLTIPGKTSVTAKDSAGGLHDVHLDAAGNHLIGAVQVLDASSVSLRDDGDLLLGDIRVEGGQLSLTTAGAIAQYAGSSVRVTNGKLVVDAGSHDVSLFGGADQVVDSVPMKIERLADGGLQVSWDASRGDVRLERASLGSGEPWKYLPAVRSADNATLQANLGELSGNEVFRLVTTSQNEFGAVEVKSAGTFKLATSGVLELDNAVVKGDLLVSARGSVTQKSGTKLDVLGNATLGSEAEVRLPNANRFGQNLSISRGRSATLGAEGGLTLGSVTLSDDPSTGADREGTLAVSASGAIQQATGTSLRVDGGTTLQAGDPAADGLKFDVLLKEGQRNRFGGPISIVAAKDVVLGTREDLLLGDAHVSGSLDAASQGDIRQASGTALIVEKDTTLTALAPDGSARTISLLEKNDFQGAVSVSEAADVALRDRDGLRLGNITLKDEPQTPAVREGTLFVDAGGRVSQTPNTRLTLGGPSTFRAVSSSGAAQDIVLDQENDFLAPVQVTDAANVTLRARNSLVLGRIATRDNPGEPQEGLLSVVSGGDISQANGTSLDIGGTTSLDAAGAISLGNANQFGGSVSVIRATGATLYSAHDLTLGDVTVSDPDLADPSTPGDLHLSSAGAINQAAGTRLVVDGPTTILAAGRANLDQANNFKGTVNAGAPELVLRDVDSLELGNLLISDTSAAVTPVKGQLTLSAGGKLTQKAGTILEVDGSTLFDNVQDVDLPAENQLAGAVSVNRGGNVTLGHGDTLLLGSITLRSESTPNGARGGDLNLVAKTAIRQSETSALQIDGTTSLSAPAVEFREDNANLFAGDFNLASANNALVTSAGDTLTLGVVRVGQNLSLVSRGTVRTSTRPDAEITVGGDTTIKALKSVGGVATPQDVALNGKNNFWGSVLITSAGNVSLRDVDALKLGPSEISGDASFVAGSGIGQAGGPLRMLKGTSTATFSTAAGTKIVLDDPANQFGTVIIKSDPGAAGTGTQELQSLHGEPGPEDVTIFDRDDLDLADLHVSGVLTIRSGGNLTQRPGSEIHVGGTTILTAESEGASPVPKNITLGNDDNDFSTVKIVNGQNVLLKDKNAIDLGASTVKGTLDVLAGGEITGSGVVDVTGLTTLTAVNGTGPQDITLDTPANKFSTVKVVNGRNVKLTDEDAIDLGASTVKGTLDVVAGGEITGSGVVDVTGVTTLTAVNGTGPQDITLDTPANKFSTVKVVNGGNVKLTDEDAIDLGASTVKGTLEVVAGGEITGSGMVEVTGVTTLTAVNGTTEQDITLDSPANKFSTVKVVNGRNVKLTDDDAIDLGASMVKGTLEVVAGGEITGSGVVEVAGVTTLTAVNGTGPQDITLDTPANKFSTVKVVNGRNVKLTDEDAIDLGASTVSGTLDVVAGGEITGSGMVDVTGVTTLTAVNGTGPQDITLDAPANKFSTVKVVNGRNVKLTNEDAIDLGASTVKGTLDVAAGGEITGSGMVEVTGVTTLTAVNGTTAQDITLDSPANKFSTVKVVNGRNVKLTDEDAIDLGASTVNGALDVVAGGEITGSGVVDVTGVTTLTAVNGTGPQDITLDEPANKFGTLKVVNGRNVKLADANGIDLGASTVKGTLDVAAGGVISESGVLDVTGVTTLTAVNGTTAQDITLGTQANKFGTVKVVNGQNVQLKDENGIDLGASTVKGTLDVVAGGVISESGVLDVTGVTTLTAVNGTTAQDITLGTQVNKFGTVKVVNGQNVQLKDENGIDLGASTVKGTLDVVAGGVISESGVLDVTGVTTLTAVNGAAPQDITLGTQVNKFGTVKVVNGQNVQLKDENGIDLGASTVKGTLDVVAGGVISESGVLDVTGVTTLTAANGTTAQDITLGTQVNKFGTVKVVNGQNVQLKDENGIDLGASTVKGTLDVVAGGVISESGVLDVTGVTTLTAVNGTTAQDITLGTQANKFGTVKVVNGQNVQLKDENGIDLGASTVKGTLDVVAGGVISESGVLDVTGVTTLTAVNGTTAQDITLGTQVNKFGTVKVVNGQNVQLKDENGIDLGASTVKGTLDVVAGGAISESGVLDVTGVTTLTAVNGAAPQDITLNTQVNKFGTVKVVNGQNVQLKDENGIDLGASTVKGTLDVVAGGVISESGVLDVTGVTTLAAVNGTTAQDITLGTQGNKFSTVKVVNGQNVQLKDENGIDLGASTVKGTLDVVAGGAISESGVLDVTGVTTLTAVNGAAPQDITLGTQVNKFGTVKVVNGQNVQLKDENGIDLGASTVKGTLDVVAGGVISESGVLDVTGVTTLTALNGAAAQDIKLGTQANKFGTVKVVNGQNVQLKDENGIDLGASTVKGTLDVVAGGVISESGVLDVTGVTTLTALNGAAAQDIKLGTQANKFGTVKVVNGQNVQLKDENGIDLGASTVKGTLDVVAGGVISESGVLDVTGVTTLTAVNGAAAQDITLGTQVNKFGTVKVVNGQNVQLKDENGIDLGASTVKGTLDVVAGGAISESGVLDVTGVTTLTAVNGAAPQDITLGTQANKFSTVKVVNGQNVQLKDENGIDLGASTVKGTLDVVAGGVISESGVLDVTGVTTLTALNGAAPQDITLGTQANKFSTVKVVNGQNVQLKDENGIDLGASTVKGTLDVVAGGVISESGVLDVTGVTTLTAVNGAAPQDITLGTQVNKFSTVKVVNGQNVQLKDENGIDLGASTVKGTLDVVAGGVISESGVLDVTGVTTLTAANGTTAQDITLGTQVNKFGTVKVVNGQNVQLKDENGIDLGASTVKGTLDVLAGGVISESGVLDVTGVTTLTAANGTTAQDITLGTQVNKFGTVKVVNGQNVQLKDENGIDLGASTVKGTLDVVAGGVISESGVLDVTGVTTLTAVNGAAAQDITLGTQVNKFSTVKVVNGQNVQLKDENGIDLGASAVKGTLDVVAGGVISESGVLDVTGVTTLTAVNGAAPQDITLGTQVNKFGTVKVVNGQNVQLKDENGIDLGASTVKGTLDVVAGGVISESGVLDVTGVTTLTAVNGTTAQDIALDTQVNKFGTVTVVKGGDVRLRDADDLNLGAVNADGALTVTTGGALTQEGGTSVLVTNGVTTLTAVNGTTAQDITLGNAGNDFKTVTVVRGGNVVLRDADELNLGAVTADGTLAVTTGGALTQEGGTSVLVTNGVTTLTAVSGSTAQDITLGNAGNDLKTVTVVRGGNVVLRDVDELNLGAVTADTALTVTTGGALTQEGGTSVLVTNGVTTLTAVKGTTPQDITLGNAGNDFRTVTVVRGGNVVLRDADELNLGAVTAEGTLTVTTGGGLTQEGGTSVLVTNGVTTLTAVNGTAAQDITLGNAGNDFKTVTVVRGGNVVLRDADDLNLGAVTADRALTVTTGGTLTQESGTAVLVTNGVTTLTAVNGTTPQDITLGNAGNDFKTVTVVRGGTVVLQDADELNLGAVNVDGALTVTTGGTLTQEAGSSVLATNGVTTLTAQIGTTGQDITLDNTGNDFKTVTVVRGGAVVLRDADELSLGAVNVDGALTVTTGGTLTQEAGSSVLATNGVTTLTAQIGTTGQDITLGNTGNDFKTVTVVRGGTVVLRDADELSLGAVNVDGALTVTTGGTLTQEAGSSVLVTNGVTTLTAQIGTTGQDITLGNTGNDFKTVTVVRGGNVVLQDVDELNLGAVTADGALTVTTGGALTQEGGTSVLVTNGVTTLTAVNGTTAQDITLGNTGNRFGSDLNVLQANKVLIRDSDEEGLRLGTVKETKEAVFIANGDISQDLQTGVLQVTDRLELRLPAGKSILLGSDQNSLPKNLVFGAVDLDAQPTNASLDTVEFASREDIEIAGPILANHLILGSPGKITAENGDNDFAKLSVRQGTTAKLVDSSEVLITKAHDDATGIKLTDKLTLTAAMNKHVVDDYGGVDVAGHGAVNQDAPIQVGGTATFRTQSGNSIYLDDARNEFLVSAPKPGEARTPSIQFETGKDPALADGRLENVFVWGAKDVTLNALRINGVLNLKSTDGSIRLNTTVGDDIRGDIDGAGGGLEIGARTIRAQAPNGTIEIVGRGNLFRTDDRPGSLSGQQGSRKDAANFFWTDQLYLYDGDFIAERSVSVLVAEIVKRQAVAQIYSPVGLGDTPPVEFTSPSPPPGTLRVKGLIVYSEEHPARAETRAR